jgi:hypothetical protein
LQKRQRTGYQRLCGGSEEEQGGEVFINLQMNGCADKRLLEMGFTRANIKIKKKPGHCLRMPG